MIKSALYLLAGSLLSTAAIADPQRPSEYNPIAAPSLPDRVVPARQDGLRLTPVGLRKLALRDEALRLRAADGGTLTPEHRAYLQHKLDRINNG